MGRGACVGRQKVRCVWASVPVRVSSRETRSLLVTQLAGVTAGGGAGDVTRRQRTLSVRSFTHGTAGSTGEGGGKGERSRFGRARLWPVEEGEGVRGREAGLPRFTPSPSRYLGSEAKVLLGWLVGRGFVGEREVLGRERDYEGRRSRNARSGRRRTGSILGAISSTVLGPVLSFRSA